MSDHAPPPPEEPKTPMWLPAVGAVLFLLVGIWWATRQEPAPPAPPGAVASASANANAAPAAK